MKFDQPTFFSPLKIKRVVRSEEAALAWGGCACVYSGGILPAVGGSGGAGFPLDSSALSAPPGCH